MFSFKFHFPTYITSPNFEYKTNSANEGLNIINVLPFIVITIHDYIVKHHAFTMKWSHRKITFS